MIQLSNTILNQYISLGLYEIRHITKAIIILICLKYIVFYHAYCENGHFLNKMICCKDQNLFCCQLRETYVRTKTT